jgi:glycosyltransferase involved in cell wall biosynthesis
MPVYNAEKYINNTIKSILNQTLQDFEFIIIDDASTDSSVNIIESYNDSRIILYKSKKNVGYVANLNKMLNLAQGEFIARQDNDDISHPQRLQRQVDYLTKNPDVGVCGSYARFIGRKRGLFKVPLDDKSIRALMIFQCPMIHPSVMIRSSTLVDGLKYDEELCPAEDYNMWFEISKKYKLANLPCPLLYYRLHGKNISILNREIQVTQANKIRSKIVEYIMGTMITEEEKRIHGLIGHPYDIDCSDLYLLRDWLMKMLTLNKMYHFCDLRTLEHTIFETWSILCRNNNRISSLKILKIYSESILFKWWMFLKKDSIKTYLKVFLKYFTHIV